MSTTTNFKISIKNQSFIVLGGLKYEKLANNVIIVTNKSPGTCFSKKSEEIGHILAQIIVLKSILRREFARPANFLPFELAKKAQNRLKKAQNV